MTSSQLETAGKSSKFDEIHPDAPLPQPKPWRWFLVTRAEIQAEVQRLVSANVAPNQRRAAEIVHPQARSLGIGMTPGMSLSVNVVLPWESLVLDRDNASRVEFGMQGEGAAMIGESGLTLAKWSTWTVPSMTRRQYRNVGSEPLVWLSYSNVPLLMRLGVHYSDEMESRSISRRSEQSRAEQHYIRQNAPDLPVLEAGARLRGYEYLTDIEVVEDRALIWPWEVVEQSMSLKRGDGKRHIMLLYNPATERRNGTTHSFFATIGSVPPGGGIPLPSRGHRHNSFACNYHFKGSGSSLIDGERVEWEAGDLLLSAPSWSEHGHGISDQGAAVLTVQDHPLHIGMSSLVWQEKMDGPILTLGLEPGQTGYVGPRMVGE